jgi:hypothetical protein
MRLTGSVNRFAVAVADEFFGTGISANLLYGFEQFILQSARRGSPAEPAIVGTGSPVGLCYHQACRDHLGLIASKATLVRVCHLRGVCLMLRSTIRARYLRGNNRRTVTLSASPTKVLTRFLHGPRLALPSHRWLCTRLMPIAVANHTLIRWWS